MSETAYSSSSVVKLRAAVEDRKTGAKKALELADNFEKTVTCLLIGNNIVNTGLSTVAVGFFCQTGDFQPVVGFGIYLDRYGYIVDFR